MGKMSREALIKWLRERIAALRGARNLAYQIDISRFLRSVRLALHLAHRFIQRFPRISLMASPHRRQYAGAPLFAGTTHGPEPDDYDREPPPYRFYFWK